ncbi:MAG TPA: molybdenum cofactor guanylyltransferase MobA [Candidatus Methylomirabilis sp.]|nr:molybdenum cofactor guanylyltransferase MobA [Candidatus Methylomirabilis sp.]
MSETGIPQTDITGVILAGGRGSRMGGADKGLVPLRGEPMITHVVARLKPQVGVLLVNANRNRDAYARLGFPVLPDRFSGFLGPLAGVASGMQAATTPYVVTVPCDSPLLPFDLVARLARALTGERAAIAVAHDGERAHPVFLLVHRELGADLLDFLGTGGRKIDQWFTRHRLAVADFRDSAQAFINVNHAEERTALEARLAETAP